VFGTFHGASTIMRRAFSWKRSRISMLDVEAVPQSWIPKVQIGLKMVLYGSSLLLNESCDFRPSNQYILVRVTSRCFRLVM
jgi:hypothetical protein